MKKGREERRKEKGRSNSCCAVLCSTVVSCTVIVTYCSVVSYDYCTVTYLFWEVINELSVDEA